MVKETGIKPRETDQDKMLTQIFCSLFSIGGISYLVTSGQSFIYGLEKTTMFAFTCPLVIAEEELIVKNSEHFIR